MAGDREIYMMHGGGPWGVRLMGGDGYPLVIAKIRARSKSANSGLHEGDVVVNINGIETDGLSHETTRNLLENAGQDLEVTIIRKASRGSAHQHTTLGSMPSSGIQMNGYSDAAVPMQTVQTEMQIQNIGSSTTLTKVSREITTGPRSMGSLLQEESYGEVYGSPSPAPAMQLGYQPTQQSAATFSPYAGAPPVAVAPAPAYAPAFAPAPAFVPAPVPAPSFSSTTVFSPAPGVSKLVPQFNVKKVTLNNSGTWTPYAGAGAQPVITPVRAPTPDQPAVWQPFAGAALQSAQEPAPAPTTWQPFAGAVIQESAAPEPIYIPEPSPLPSYVSPDYAMQIDAEELDLHKYRYYKHDEILSDDEYPCYEALGDSVPNMRRRKIYADSSFYDDPEHKYPTIEEQIKMARKVALSLMAPQNKTTRGHKMFLKSAQKSDRWVALGDDDPRNVIAQYIEDDDEKYYNPHPWRGSKGISLSSAISNTRSNLKPTGPRPHPYPVARTPEPPRAQPVQQSPVQQAPVPRGRPGSWQPPSQLTAQLAPENRPSPQPAPSPIPMQRSRTPNCIPAPPPLPAPPAPRAMQEDPHFWATRQPCAMDEMDTSVPLSALELERVRLSAPKSTHSSVPQAPQKAFALADGMRNATGKGGRLFAKKRERAMREDAENPGAWGQVDVNEKPNAEIMQRLAYTAELNRPKSPPRKQDSRKLPDGPPEDRLSTMIGKSALTAWDAAAATIDGSTDMAFTHLNRPFLSGSGIQRPTDFDNVRSNPLRSSTAFIPSSPQPTAPAGPNYNNKPRGWNNSGDSSVISSAGLTPTTPDAAASSGANRNFNNTKMRGWGGEAASEIKPISFKAPLGMEPKAPSVFESPAASEAYGQMNGYEAGADGDGYCDL